MGMCKCKKQDGCQKLLIAKRGATSQTSRETGCKLPREPVWGRQPKFGKDACKPSASVLRRGQELCSLGASTGTQPLAGF